MNYVLEDMDTNDIIACGVIPSCHSIPIHSTSLSVDKIAIRVSLWGCNYSPTTAIKAVKEKLLVHLNGKSERL